VEPGRESLLRAYRQIKTIRDFEERLHVEIQTGEIPGFTHLYAGQEAVAVGVCDHLGDDDYIVSTHRGHGHCIAKGCDVTGMMLEIYGRAGGLCKGKGGSMHIADVTKGMLGANAIVGGGAPLAVGAAIACKLRGAGRVSVAFGGDGSANQGTVFEAMNLAVVLQAPTIFVFENNGYSEHTGAGYAVGSKDIAGRARGFGMPAEVCDGADFFAVHAAMGRAVERARRGEERSHGTAREVGRARAASQQPEAAEELADRHRLPRGGEQLERGGDHGPCSASRAAALSTRAAWRACSGVLHTCTGGCTSPSSVRVGLHSISTSGPLAQSG